jgi:HK97 family phage portal protein
MSNSIATSTRSRLVKAARSRDATFSAVGGSLRALAGQTLSLLQGKERIGWAVGVDGYTARTLDQSPATLLGQLSLNEIVYACMRERMKVLISPAFVVERRQADGTYVVEHDHELAALLRRPGPNLDAPTLWRCLEASYASIGRLYLEPIYGSASRTLRGLNPLNPVYITERYEDGRLVWYDWTPPDAPNVRFAPDELIVRRAVDWADVPPLIAALGSVEADQLSNDFMRGFFSNAGVPSGIVKVRGSWSQTLTDTFRSTWMERFGPGGMAQGGPAIFDENIESYTRLGVSLNELDNETLRMFIETRICMCFGVPPLIIYAYAGLLKATYSNLQEAWSSFWDATALPLLKEWAEWVNWSLLTLYEDRDDVLLGNVRTRFDPAGLGPYQEDVNAKIEMYRDAYDKGAVTMNELRAVMGLAAHPDGDVFKAPAAPPIPWQVPPAEAPDEQQIADDQAAAQTEGKASPSVLERHVAQYIEGEYAKARRLLLSSDDVDAAIAGLDKELDDGLKLTAILAPSLRRDVARAYHAAGGTKAAIPRTATFATERIIETLRKRAAGIAETTRNEIAAAMRAGLDLVTAGRERASTRAETIVTTETATAETAGQLAGFGSRGVKTVRWTVGANPCSDCEELDGKEYPIDDAPDLPAHPFCGCSLAEVPT